MSVFLETNHLFLRDPRAGVEDVAAMAAAGFGAVFCNVGDHAPDTWATIRSRAATAGIACGPWLRTADSQNRFDYDRFHALIRCADDWASPLIVNSESELQGSGSEITSYIDAQLGSRDAAISVEAWPFDNVAWWPFASRPVLPQLFKADVAYDEPGLRDVWHAYGVRCVVLTFGSYHGSTPAIYDRLSPYGVYTADDCAGDYGAWSAKGAIDPCQTSPVPVPPDPGGPTVIGSQDGVTASCNRWRELDPSGTLLVKAPDSKGKLTWPGIETLAGTPLDKWKAYDKLERALSILCADHDANASV